jgi:hypothetical protein
MLKGRFMRTRIITFKSVAFYVMILASCWGCGSRAGSPPPLISVKGKVIYNHQPLTKGTVQFEPDGFGRPAFGKLQSDGTFVLTTLKEGDGVVAGHHRVSISGVDKSLARNRAFQKYASPNTSKLTADVSEDQTEFTFDIP